MSFKKYDGSAWQPISPKQLKGIPYTGTLPATLTGTKAGYLHRYKIYGNTEQDSGTPTPSDPIYPSECGERTENLFDKNGKDTTKGYIDHAFVVSTGAISTSQSYAWYVSEYIDISGMETLYIQGADGASNTPAICFYDENYEYISGVAYARRTALSVSVPQAAKFCRVSINGSPQEDGFMLNSGSTALPYEPYGYKLPLTSAGQDVDIYLGESQTTRRIKKLVFDGTENWRIDDGRFTLAITSMKSQGLRLTEFYCSSYQVISDGRAYADVPNNAIYTGTRQSFGTNIYIHTDEYTALTSYKEYLAQQYTNGTPVTIWYILAEPETGALNEPLRKIGNYADTIDSTQTTAQIPTLDNSTTISWAGSGLAPSEFDSIQEWVDIPTYTYTNGEWVADN